MAKKRSQKTKRQSKPQGGRRGVLENLTPNEWKEIMSFISGGVYDYIAAEACGVMQETFTDWMVKGRQDILNKRDTNHARFFQDVMKAKSKARGIAELRVNKDKPLAWLRYGPGRSKPGREGWTSEVELKHTGTIEHDHEVNGEVEVRHVLGPSPNERIAALSQVFGVLAQAGLDPLRLNSTGETLEEALEGEDELDEGPENIMPEGMPLPHSNGNGHVPLP